MVAPRHTPGVADAPGGTSHRGSRAALAGLLAASLALVLAVAGCGASDADAPGLVRDVVSGEDVVSLSPGGEPEAIVLYLHGMGGGSEDVVSGKMAPMAESLVEAGYAVVASDAGGDGFGNPAGREDHAAALAWARDRLGDAPVVLLAESMGGLSALPLMAGGELDPVAGMVGISPALTTRGWRQSSLGDEIGAAWRSAPPADPLTLPVEDFRGDAFLFYVAPEDDVTPTSVNAGAFADRVEGIASVTLVACRGGHVDPSCYRPAEVTRWVQQQLAER